MTTAHDMYAAVFNSYYGGPERYKARGQEAKPVIVAHSPPGERLWLRVRMPNGDTWDYGANSDELSNDILEQNFSRVRGKFNLRKPRNIGRLLSHIRELSKDPDSITATKLQPRGKAPIPAVEPSAPPAIEEPEDELLEQEFDREADPLQETLATEHAGESQYSAQAKHAGEPHDRLALLLEKAGNARAIKLGKPGSKAFFIVSPSTRETSQGQWQLSRFDDSGQTGHRNFNTKEEAIGGAIGIDPAPTRQKSLFDDYSNLGDPSYDITEKYTTTFDADAMLAYYGQDANVERYAKGFGLPKRRNTIKPTAGQQDLFGKGAAEEQPAMQPPAPVASETVANPPQASQEKPAMAASRQMQKALGFSTKASHPLSEHGMEKFEGETHKFHVENPTIDLPEGRELVDTRHIIHNGKLFRVSVISDPNYGRYFNIEEGVVTNPEMAIETQGEQSAPTQTFGHVQVKMEPASFETLQGIAHSNEFAPVRAMIGRTATRNQTQGGAPGRETAKSMASRVLSQVKGHGKPLIEDVLKKSLGLPADKPLPKDILKAIKSLRERGEIKVGKTESTPVQIVITKASKSKPKAKSQVTEDPSKLRQEIRSREKELKSLEELAKGQTGEQLEVTSQKIDKASKELDKMRVQAIQLREGEIKKRPQPQLAMVDPKHGQSPRMSAGDVRLNKIGRAIQSVRKRIKPLQNKFDSLSPEEQEATPSPRLDSLLDRLKNLTTARDAAVRARKQAATTTEPRIGGPAENPPPPKQNIRRGLEGLEAIPSMSRKPEPQIETDQFSRVSDAILSVRKRLRDLNRKLARTSKQNPQRKQLESQIAAHTASYRRLAEQRSRLSQPRHQPFSNAARRLIDATLERYTALRARDSLLRRFCANYYGTVERYGGQQSGPHIDNQSILNGVSIPALTKPIKMQALPTDGQPRGAKGSLNPGQFTGPGKLPSITPLPSPVKMSLPDQYAARGKSRQTTARGIPMIGGIPIADPTMFLSWPAPPREEEAVKKGARPLSTAQQRPLTWEGTNQLAALAVSTGKQVYQKQQQIDSLQAQARQMSGPEQVAAANQIQSLSQERDELLKKHNAAADQTIEDLDKHFHWRASTDRKKTRQDFHDDLVQYYRTYVWDALNRWTKGKKGYDPEKTYNPTQAGIQTFIKTAEKAIKGRFWRDRKNFVQGLTEDAANDIREQHERELTGEKGEQQPKKRRGRAIIQQFDENYDDTEGGRHLSEARWEDTATTPELVDRLLTELRHTTNRKAIIKHAVNQVRGELEKIKESQPTKFKDRINLSTLDQSLKDRITVLSKANNDIDRYSKSLQQSVDETWARIHRELQGLSKKAQSATDPKSLEQMQASLSGLQSSMKALSDELPQHGMTIPLPDPSWTEESLPESPVSKARKKRIEGVHEGFSKLSETDQELLKMHFGLFGGDKSGASLEKMEKTIRDDPQHSTLELALGGTSTTHLMKQLRNAEKRLYQSLPEWLRIEVTGGEGVPRGVPSAKKFVTLTADYINGMQSAKRNQKLLAMKSQGVTKQNVRPIDAAGDTSQIEHHPTKKSWDQRQAVDQRIQELEEQLRQVGYRIGTTKRHKSKKPTQQQKREIDDIQRQIAEREREIASHAIPHHAVEVANDMKELRSVEKAIDTMWDESGIDPKSGRPSLERWFEHTDTPIAMDYNDIVKMHQLYAKRENLLSRTKSAFSPLGRFKIESETESPTTAKPEGSSQAAPQAQPKQPWETPPTAPLQTKKKPTKSKGPSGPMLFTRQDEPDKYGFVTDAAGIEIPGESTPTYEETLSSIPLQPSRFPSPPKQPRNTGERWAVHTGMADIETLKRVKAAADRKGLVLKVVVPPTGTGKQQAGEYRFYTFTQKGLERFQQQGRPARYRAGLDKYGWRSMIGLPEKQQAPPPPEPPPEIGGDDLPDVPRPQTSAEERASRKAASPPPRATTQSSPTPQPVVQRTQQPLSKKDIDELSRIQSQEARFSEWLRDPTQGPYPDPREMAPRRPPTSAATTKRSSQLTPEQQKIEDETRENKRIAANLSAKRRRQYEEDVASGKIVPGKRRGSKPTDEAEKPPESFIKLHPIPPSEDAMKHIKRGADTFVFDIKTRQRIPAYYAFIDIRKVIGSHIRTPDGRYVPNPERTDKSEQPRSYERGSENERKVHDAANDKVGDFFTNLTPVPSDGPPTLEDQKLQVSNGSSRLLTMYEALARGEYDWIRKAVIEAARNPRIAGTQTPEDVAKMDYPGLFRIIPGIPSGTEEFKRLASLGNISTTHEETNTRSAAQMGNIIFTKPMLTWLGDKMQSQKSDISLPALLKNPNSALRKAVIEGIPRQQMNKWYDPKTKQFTEYAINQIEDGIVSRFIDVDTLELGERPGMRSLKSAIGTCVPQLLQIGSPIRRPLERAFSYIAKRSDIANRKQFEEDSRSQSLFGDKDEKKVDEMAKSLVGMLYEAKSDESGTFRAKDIRSLFVTIAAVAKVRQRDDPLWVQVEDIKYALEKNSQGKEFTKQEQDDFKEAVEKVGFNFDEFMAMPEDRKFAELEDRRQRAAKSSSFIGPHEGSWLDQILEAQEARVAAEARKKQRDQEAMSRGVGLADSQQSEQAQSPSPTGAQAKEQQAGPQSATSPSPTASPAPQQRRMFDEPEPEQNPPTPTVTQDELIANIKTKLEANKADLEKLQRKFAAERNPSTQLYLQGRIIDAESEIAQQEKFLSQSASQSQPSSTKLSLRKARDATLDLYSAVHMAYYGKRRHQRGTARKFIS